MNIRLIQTLNKINENIPRKVVELNGSEEVSINSGNMWKLEDIGFLSKFFNIQHFWIVHISLNRERY